MANYSSDNFSQPVFNGAYGNKSFAHASFADIGLINASAGFALADTFDIVKIPAGARVLSGFVYTGTVTLATSTISVGVKYADGTSTGGTTGTAALSGGTAIPVTTAKTQVVLNFTPFTNDVDTIIYGVWSSPGALAGTNGAQLDFVIDYSASGSK